LMCVRNVDGIGFEHVLKVGLDRATNLRVVTQRRMAEILRIVPRSIEALERFVRNMARFRMPIEALLTIGSVLCRCSCTPKGELTNNLSNHARGDAVDIVGVRWQPPSGRPRGPGDPPGRLHETVVYNFGDSGELALLRRIDACLRLSFPNVIDYNRKDHRDHFHCDLSTSPDSQRNTMRFTQEILRFMRNRPVAITGELDGPTQTALQESFGWNRDPGTLRSVLELLFTGVASGRL
jgi:hypothetical protein